MNGHGWKFWLYGSSLEASPIRASSNEGARDESLPAECARCTLLLTALFDGEASETEVQQARRHLLGCGRCAQTWLGWNQTRVLLLDQSVPKAPPTLVGRIRLACGLIGKTTTPDLHGQILARTSRQGLPRSAKSKPRLVWPALSLPAPVWGATALGALVLLLAHDSLPTASLVPDASPSFVAQDAPSARSASNSMTRNGNTARRDEELAVLPSEARAHTAPGTTVSLARAKRAASPATFGSPDDSDAARTLSKAQRERESLSSPALQPAPLPVLASLGFEDRPFSIWASKTSKAATRRSRAQLFAAPRGVQGLSSPAPALRVLASRPIVLASVPVASLAGEADLTPPAPVSAPLGSAHRGRFLLASAPLGRASLRISAPRVRPITVGQDPVSEDAGLEDLDSTVQEYRSSLSDDSSDSNGAG